MTAELWTNGAGKPLKFQAGDSVKIEVPWNAVLRPPFLTGYVIGYDMSGYPGQESVAYVLHKMGHPPLESVVERFLTKIPDFHPHHHYPRDLSCGICGLLINPPSE